MILAVAPAAFHVRGEAKFEKTVVLA